MIIYEIKEVQEPITEHAGLPFPDNSVYNIVGYRKMYGIFNQNKQVGSNFKSKKAAKKYFLSRFTKEAVLKDIEAKVKNFERIIKLERKDFRKWIKEYKEKLMSQIGELK